MDYYINHSGIRNSDTSSNQPQNIFKFSPFSDDRIIAQSSQFAFFMEVISPVQID